MQTGDARQGAGTYVVACDASVNLRWRTSPKILEYSGHKTLSLRRLRTAATLDFISVMLPNITNIGEISMSFVIRRVSSHRGVGTGASASFGDATSLGTLSVPPSWADALSVAAPEPVLDANVVPGGWGTMSSPTSGAGVSKMPLGGMVGRESLGAVQRVGFRSSLIPRSPVAG
jgi:hypothetical protein